MLCRCATRWLAKHRATAVSTLWRLFPSTMVRPRRSVCSRNVQLKKGTGQPNDLRVLLNHLDQSLVLSTEYFLRFSFPFAIAAARADGRSHYTLADA